MRRWDCVLRIGLQINFDQVLPLAIYQARDMKTEDFATSGILDKFGKICHGLRKHAEITCDVS